MAVASPLISVSAFFFCDAYFAALRAGSSSPARMPMMAMTTSSSMSVNPAGRRDERTSDVFIGLDSENERRPELCNGAHDCRARRSVRRGCQARSNQFTGRRRASAVDGEGGVMASLRLRSLAPVADAVGLAAVIDVHPEVVGAGIVRGIAGIVKPGADGAAVRGCKLDGPLHHHAENGVGHAIGDEMPGARRLAGGPEKILDLRRIGRGVDKTRDPRAVNSKEVAGRPHCVKCVTGRR